MSISAPANSAIVRTVSCSFPVPAPPSEADTLALILTQINQLGEDMTALKNATQIDQTDAQIISGAATTSGSPLPVPAANKNSENYSRLLTANLSDYCYSANQAGRIIEQSFTNQAGSAAFIWTVNSQSGETWNAPDLSAATSFSLANGETRTFRNINATTWEEV